MFYRVPRSSRVVATRAGLFVSQKKSVTLAKLGRDTLELFLELQRIHLRILVGVILTWVA